MLEIATWMIVIFELASNSAYFRC